jgi:hypothetical protein
VSLSYFVAPGDQTYMPFSIYRDSKGGDRDIFNEKPTREEQTVAMETEPVKVAASGRTAVIHTTKGDIVSILPRLAATLADLLSSAFPLASGVCPQGSREFCGTFEERVLQWHYIPSNNQEIRKLTRNFSMGYRINWFCSDAPNRRSLGRWYRRVIYLGF